MAQPFLDDFEDAFGTLLESHTPSGGTAWILTGTSGAYQCRSGGAVPRDGKTGVYRCDAQGSADNYTQSIFNQIATLSYTATRIQDSDNFIGIKVQTAGAAGVRLVKIVAGTETTLITTTFTAGNTYKVEASSSSLELFDNGVSAGSVTETSFQTEVDQGVINRGIGLSSGVQDDFEAGALAAAATSATTGTAVPTQTEADIVTGGKTIILTLTGDTFVTGTTSLDGIAAGSDSDIAASGTNWDSLIKTTLDNTNVVLSVGDTVATITLPAFASYDIAGTETITWTIPAASLTTSASPIVSSPTHTITAVGGGFQVSWANGSNSVIQAG